MAVTTLRREYSAREFNRDPSAVSRAARQFGRVRVTNRGQTSLIVLDAAQFPEMDAAAPMSLLQALSMDADWNEDSLGEPPRACVIPQLGDFE